MNKFDITSTALEKGFDIAKEFLDKLIIPAVEETGLLLRDNVKLWRFKNQIKVLNKAKIYCEKKNITPKTIPLKLLCPTLEYASLEEDESMSDNWAILLSNLVDSKQNIENHVFPYLLSQISINEFNFLKEVYKIEINTKEQYRINLLNFREQNKSKVKELQCEIEKIEKLIDEESSDRFNNGILKMKLERKLRIITNQEANIIRLINGKEAVPIDSLVEYEISNLIRLGVVEKILRSYAYVNSNDHIIKSEDFSVEDLEIEIEHDYDEYFLTQLGKLFIKACSEKK